MFLKFPNNTMKKVVVDLKEVRKVVRLLHPRPVVIVTCSNEKDNALTIAWSMPTSFKPPMIAVSISPRNYSHSIIDKTNEFVVNVPTIDLLEETYFIGTKSGRDIDKFSKLKLTKKPAKFVKAPILEECFANLECKVVGKIKTGDHTLFVGEVLAAYSSEDAFSPEEVVNCGKYEILLHYGKDLFTTVSDRIFKPKRIY